MEVVLTPAVARYIFTPFAWTGWGQGGLVIGTSNPLNSNDFQLGMLLLTCEGLKASVVAWDML